MNSAAADDLNSKSYYCSSVHCSYYSSVQLMLHIIYYRINLDERSLKAEFKKYNDSFPNQKIGLHEYYINIVRKYLLSSGQKEEARDFNSEIIKLKQMRTTSDYKDEVIGPDESRRSRLKAIEINKILQKAC